MPQSTSTPILRAAFLLCSIALGLKAQSSEDILKQYREADKANAALARQYTFVGKTTHVYFDSKGSRKNDESLTYDFVFVEGERYGKLIARNDQPLSAKETAEEEKKLQQTAEERRQHRANNPIANRNVSLASVEDSLRLSSCYLVGPEPVKERQAWLIECKPKDGVKPSNGKEKEKYFNIRRLWIDQQTSQLLKFRDTAIEGHPTMTPGSVIEGEYSLVNNEVWMLTSSLIDGHLRIAGIIKPKVRTEYLNTNFKKFDVQSTVTPQG